MNVGTTDTTCVDCDVNIIFLECLELEFFLVEGLPSVGRVNGGSQSQAGGSYCLGSLMTNPVAVSG